ncbi:MAG TPA: CinA family nicotinamide mononucleotide deamidase-related protein [Thermoanaerobaculia bacterium]|nr:CinA family nicotinamide mononucleotide deamidase-related protein [Thermoanaerobaculia bacterium]
MEEQRQASIIAIGSEMLGPIRVDTNSLKITAALESFGIPVVRKSVVGDLLADLVAEIRYGFDRADILVITGGLGPTEDDLTREALAETFGLTMQLDQAIVDTIAARFAARGWVMPEVNRKQGNVFAGQTTLLNDRGTAPGFHIETGGRHVWVFPGVPHELEWMLGKYFTPWLAEVCGGRPRQRRVLKIAGMTESGVEEKLRPYYERHPGELVTILASGGQIEVHLSSDAPEFITTREAEIREIFAEKLFGVDDDSLESVVGALLTARGQTVSTAESCTGGLLGSRITDISGSSAYYLGGGVCYTAAAKTAIAGVDPELIAAHGEVSEEVATALAKGIRERFGTTWGVGITGIAGPTGGSPDKPVGTVHVAVAGPHGEKHRKLLWQGPRTIVKWYSTQQALDLLRRSILRDAHE